MCCWGGFEGIQDWIDYRCTILVFLHNQGLLEEKKGKFRVREDLMKGRSEDICKRRVGYGNSETVLLQKCFNKM